MVNTFFLHIFRPPYCNSNQALTDTPGILNEDPMGKGWFMKVKMTEGVPDTLLKPPAYEELCAKSD